MMYSKDELKILMYETIEQCVMEWDDPPEIVVHKITGFNDLLATIEEKETEKDKITEA